MIIDSCFRSLDEAVRGLEFPYEIREVLTLVDVQYVSFDGLVHRGQVVIHKKLATDVREVFAALLELRFPVARVVPIVEYGWDDDASMLANNSSGFNYRVIVGTDRISEHAKGLAFDLNPLQNPHIGRGGRHSPNVPYSPAIPGTITADGPVAKLFKARGWDWGGDWKDRYGILDYQHFEKMNP
jgi:hypothetical protein